MKQAERVAVTAEKRFSSAANTYASAALPQRSIADELATRLPDPSASAFSSILEIGCGTGFLTRHLTSFLPEAALTCLDVSPGMIESARANNPQDIRWITAGFLEADLSTFDLVVSSSALHWIIPFKQAAARLSSVLAPRGKLVAAIMVHGTLHELHAARIAAAPAKRPFAELPSSAAVQEALVTAGFQILSAAEKSFCQMFNDPAEVLEAIHRKGLTGGLFSRSVLPLTRGELLGLCKAYKEGFSSIDNRVPATYQVLFVEALRE